MSLPRHVLVLTMFDLTRLDRAMAVRPYNLYTSLQALAPTEMIAGGWLPRRREILHYLLRGGLRRTRAVYVEASTTTATETDLLFLALLRLAKNGHRAAGSPHAWRHDARRLVEVYRCL